MAAKKRTKKQSLREFRAWLEGVEELQPDNWCPNLNQWKLIRDKIDGIKEEVIEKTVVNNNTAPAPNPNNPYNNPAQVPQSSMIPAAPMIESSIPQGPVTVAPTVNPMFNPHDGKTRTPDIDTSDGNVNSSFA